MGYWIQRLTIIAVAVAGVVLSPIIMMQFLQYDFLPLACFAGFIVLVLFLSQDSRKQWIWIPCAALVPWSLNFLPINFSLMELVTIVAFFHFFLTEVVFKKRGIFLGDQWVVIFISIIMLVIFYHWFKQGIGFRVLGGDTVGARKNFSMILGCIAYLTIVTSCRNQFKTLNRLPFFILVAAFIGMLPFLISRFIPSTAGILYYLTGSASLDVETQFDLGDAQIDRMSYLGPFANALQLWLISNYPLKTWWRPDRWVILGLSFLAFYLCLKTGFRSNLFSFIMITLAGAFCSLGWKAILAVFPLGFVAAVLSLGQGAIFDLPLPIQRTLSFLPGAWSEQVLHTTEASNGFREQIQSIYLTEFVSRSPWIGNGFNYDASEVTGILTFAKWDQDPYNFHKGFIIRKDFHVGWISLYDPVGIVGAIGFVGLFTSAFFLILQVVKHYPPGGRPPIVIWLFAQLVTTVFTFFAVFGALQVTMPMLCVLSALIICVRRHVLDLDEGNLTAEDAPPPSLSKFHGSPQKGAIS